MIRGENGIETVGVAACAGYHGLLVGLGFLLHTGCGATRFGKNVFAIGLRAVLHILGILLCGLNILKGVLYIGMHFGGVDEHLRNVNSRFIIVEDLLHDRLGIFGHAATFRCDDLEHASLADHFPDRALRHFTQRIFGVFDVENKFFGGGNVPLHDKIKINDVEV